jgi:hypothetical protein
MDAELMFKWRIYKRKGWEEWIAAKRGIPMFWSFRTFDEALQFVRSK